MSLAASGMMLTVVVPVYKQWNILDGLLECLKKQTLPTACFRIVLVNNEIGFNTDRYANEPVTIIDCDEPGSYAARNRGVATYLSCTDWFLFTDADCRPEPDWLENMQSAMQCCQWESLISGSVEMVTETSQPGWAEIHDLVKGIPQKEYAAKGFGATANLAVPAEAFRKAGMFDTSAFSGGDRLFCLKAACYGYPLHYCPTACVKHPARTCYPDVARKARRIRGAQIARSQGLKRWIRVLYSVGPPALPIIRLLQRRDRKISHRIIASIVQCRIWFDEISEVGKAINNRPLERR